MHLGIDFNRMKKSMYQTLRRSESAIQIDRANQGFKRIGEDGGSLLPTGARLPLPKPDNVRQTQLNSQLMQRVLLHEIGTDTRKIAFR